MVTALRALDTRLRSITPFGMTALFALLTVLPFTMPFDTTIVPSFTLMAVFYWTVYRPDLLPAPAIFVIGVVQDALIGGPLGLNALILLGTYGVVLNQRRVFLGKPFAVTWWGFTLVAAVAQLVNWFISSLLAGTPLSTGQPVVQFVLTTLLFPLVVWLFIRTHRRVLPQV